MQKRLMNVLGQQLAAAVCTKLFAIKASLLKAKLQTNEGTWQTSQKGWRARAQLEPRQLVCEGRLRMYGYQGHRLSQPVPLLACIV